MSSIKTSIKQIKNMFSKFISQLINPPTQDVHYRRVHWYDIIIETITDLFRFFSGLFKTFFFFFHKDRFVSNMRMLRWNKLDSYIMKQFLFSMIGSITLFVSIYEMSQIFQDMRRLPDDVDRYYLNLHYWNTVPYWTFILQPFGFLFATAYVLSRLSASREMVAMVSTGTSIYRLTFYMLLLSVLYYIFIVTFLMNNFILPSYQNSFIYRRVALKQAKLGELSFLNDNKDFTIFGKNQLLYLGSYYNATDKYIENATIVQYEDPDKVDTSEFTPYDSESEWLYTNRIKLESLKNIRVKDKLTFKLRIDAERLYWNTNTESWAISNGTIRSIEDGGKIFMLEEVVYKTMPDINDPYWFFEKNWYPIDAMTVEEGLRHIQKLKQSGRSYHAELTKYYAKDAYPLGLIFVVMVGIGIVNMASKKVSVPINSAISMALFIIYYLMYTSFLGMAGRGDVTPIVGGFGGSIIFGVLALILYAKSTT
ncbi:MAG: LptF/LptG family permease [Brevinema sp.]